MFEKSVSPARKRLIATPLLVLLLNLTACDMIQKKMGIEDPALKEARIEAEGKAVGSACRHSGRAIEDCYSIYNWLPKASVFTGWREMDAYMRDNKIETTEPLLPPTPPPPLPETTKKKPKEKTAATDAKEATKEKTPAAKDH